MISKLLKNTNWRIWLAIVGSGTLIIGTTYTMVQQSTRLSAQDLPLQAAQTAKHQLESGTSAQSVAPITSTDLASDSTIFVTITNAQHKILASNARLEGQPTLPPEGTFDYTASHGTDHFSWEPLSGVRQATQMLTYKDGFIITGQSLKPYENRINTYGLLAIAGWLAMVIWSFVLILLPSKKPGHL
jgi:hypothetical protein